jgi:S-formylglutathione hydrolase FrmB
MRPETWITGDKVPQRVDAAFAAGAQQMIIVLPSAQTLHDGSMYSNSVTTGDWETFITRDVVQYIDSHLPHDCRPREARPDGPFDRRLWDDTAGHEVP